MLKNKHIPARAAEAKLVTVSTFCPTNILITDFIHEFSRQQAVLRIRIRVLFDPWIQDPGSGMAKESRFGSGIRDEHPGSYFQELRNNFLG
jgi:hypothetical protein